MYCEPQRLPLLGAPEPPCKHRLALIEGRNKCFRFGGAPYPAMAEINGRPTSPTAPLVLLKDAKTGEGAAGPVGGGTNAKRSPTFDSLRGMGVVLVMLYHLRLGVPNAWACIGLFFAGSGFVMTVMAIEVVAKKGAFDAPLFWKRRVLRLFPALQV